MLRALFDASRLIFRAAKGGSLTGIDRVAMAYGRWMLSREDLEVQATWCFRGALYPIPHDFFSELAAAESAEEDDREAWQGLVRALSESAPTGAALRTLHPRGDRLSLGRRSQISNVARQAILRWRPLHISRFDFYCNVSHYGLGQEGLLEGLHRKGVRVAAMVHDLIPISHPEYCTPGSDERHEARMDALLDHGSLVITNSRTTAAEFSEFGRARGKPVPQICVAPLGLEARFLTRDHAPLDTREFFICVGTIEPRKNLAFLLTIWRRLAERLGEATPHLVLVGRRGWETEAVIDLLERAPSVRRFVHEVSDISDRHLAELMASANALLAPSFTEGFDLPFMEAQSLGAPVIASDIPVHREFASGARLIDPLDGPAWIDAILATQGRMKTPGAFDAPTWSGHFRLLAESLGLSPN